MKKHLNKQGFSLVELLVAMLATAILALTVSLLLYMPFRTMRTNNEYARIRRDMAFAIQIMAKDIRAAHHGDFINTSTFSADNQVALPSNVAAGRLDKIEFKRNAAEGSLIRYVNDAARLTVIPEGLSRFHSDVLTDAAGLVTGILLDLEMQNSDGDVVMTRKTFIYMRN